MLASIECARFRQGKISFGEGLNVVLGDEQASNSIGKSTLLMLVDFGHGGSDFLTKMPEVANNLGHHGYSYTFKFEGDEYSFRRYTDQANVVFPLSSDGAPGKPLKIDEFKQWLKEKYEVRDERLAFRACVSPFSRIWLRDTFNPSHPFHPSSRSRTDSILDRLVMRFEAYEEIAQFEEQLKEAQALKKALSAARRANLIPTIRKRDYQANQAKINEAEAELSDFSTRLDLFAANISEIVNREALEAKQQKDTLLDERRELQARLAYLGSGTPLIRPPTRRSLEKLVEFFPSVNVRRLSEISEFHGELSRILRREISGEVRYLDDRLEVVSQQLCVVDGKLEAILGSHRAPRMIVERIVKVASGAAHLRRVNKHYEERLRIESDAKELSEAKAEARTLSLAGIAEKVNRSLEALAKITFPKGRRAPRLDVSTKDYRLVVDQDTGTGTTQAALVLVDLTMLELTSLPYIVHDTVLLKDIETPVLNKIFELYSSRTKQTFIAMDEAHKFGSAGSRLLKEAASVKLSSSETLYDLDWRTVS